LTRTEPRPAGERLVRRAVRRPSAESIVIAVCAAAALSLRWYQLARPGYLFGVTEYDDGVLFGNALRLAAGVLPYRDFAMVQPPGSALLMVPAALLAKVAGTATGLAAGRLLTAGADTASVVLLGVLVRHRGPLTAGVACGSYAVYPDAIIAAHTLLLEPWLNLFCLAGAVLLFDGDRMAGTAPCLPPAAQRAAYPRDTRRLAWGGVLFGFAVAVKIWALVPLGIAGLLLVAATHRTRPAAVLAAGAAAGLGLPLLPFAVLAPGAVARGVVIGQEVRNADGGGDSLGRLANMAGLHLLPARFPPGLFLMAIGAVAAACYAAAYLAARRPVPVRETYSLTGAIAVTAMFLFPRFYYSHYGAFDGPFLALAVALPIGLPIGLLSARLATGRTPANLAGTAVATALGLVLMTAGIQQFRAESVLHADPVPAAADRLIPAGACVLTNDVAYTVEADRFYSDVRGCPPMVDSFGTLFAMTSGQSANAAAAVLRPVVELWQEYLERAGYVWFTSTTAEQIPWNPRLYGYFYSHFRLIGLAAPHWSNRSVPRPGLYVRVMASKSIRAGRAIPRLG
jgi:alpha-1,2-mannosyltransferase